MTIAAAHIPFENRVVGRQIELGLLIQMTLKTSLGRFARIDDGLGGAARLNVQASRAMTRFASDIFCVVSGCLQLVVTRGVETVINLLMACLAGLRTDKSRPRNLRRSHHLRLAHAGARDHTEDCEDAKEQGQNPPPATLRPRCDSEKVVSSVQFHKSPPDFSLLPRA